MNFTSNKFHFMISNNFIEGYDEEMKEAASEEKDNPLRQQRGRKRNDPALIGLDIWESLPRFVSQFPQSLDSYDMDDLSYNTLFSEFVEKVRGQ